MACKSAIPSILKTLNKFLITKDVYNKFESNFYDYRHVEPIIEQFLFFVKKSMDGLEHPDLITECIKNMYTAAYL